MRGFGIGSTKAEITEVGADAVWILKIVKI